MKVFTGNKDTDLRIIQNLEDKEIYTVGKVNRYVYKLCEDENFWINRLLNRSKFSIEKINKIKGDLTYKKLYKYLYLGDYGQGFNHAIQNDNVYLYKLIPIKKFHLLYTTVINAAGFGSIEILNYIFLSISGDDRYNFILSCYSGANDKTINWLDKMDLIDYSQFISKMILEGCDEDDYTYDMIKKYLHEVKYTEDFMDELGYSLSNSNLESRKKIFDLFIENNIDIDYYENAILAAEDRSVYRCIDKNKLINWVNYVNNKMKRPNKK